MLLNFPFSSIDTVIGSIEYYGEKLALGLCVTAPEDSIFAERATRTRRRRDERALSVALLKRYRRPFREKCILSTRA